MWFNSVIEKQSKRPKANKRKRSSAAPYQLVYTAYLEPSRGQAEKRILPHFKPMKMMKILREKTGGNAIVASAEVTNEIFDRIQAQQVELLQALGLDATKPDYAQAFLELARAHHGVGTVEVESARAPNKNAAKWTARQDEALLEAVRVRQKRGMKVTAAVREIANDEKIWSRFPPKDSVRKGKPAGLLREQNFRRRIAFLRKRSAEQIALAEVLDGLAGNDPHAPLVKVGP